MASEYHGQYVFILEKQNWSISNELLQLIIIMFPDYATEKDPRMTDDMRERERDGLTGRKCHPAGRILRLKLNIEAGLMQDMTFTSQTTQC